MWRSWTNDDVRARVDELDLNFNDHGLVSFGVSQDHLALFYSVLQPIYRRYFRMWVEGIEHMPAQGAAMLIGNHSGGVPADGAMVAAATFFESNPPRHVHGMVEKFVQNLPFVSPLMSRIGQLTGLPEHAERILRAGRVLLVFPEGVRGVGKLYQDRYNLTRFGTGFMRIAMKTNSPIIPFGYVGAEEALPTLFHAKLPARLTGVPYWPVPPHLLPIPLPMPCGIHFGEPMIFEGDGTESDELVDQHVHEVRSTIVKLIAEGRLKNEGMQ